MVATCDIWVQELAMACGQRAVNKDIVLLCTYCHAWLQACVSAGISVSLCTRSALGITSSTMRLHCNAVNIQKCLQNNFYIFRLTTILASCNSVCIKLDSTNYDAVHISTIHVTPKRVVHICTIASPKRDSVAAVSRFVNVSL